MAFVRTSIREFTLANPLYVGASVTFYTVSGGAPTSTKATLYAAATGTATISNPQALDSTGKMAQPAYTEVPVIGSVSGALVAPDHNTGVISPGSDDLQTATRALLTAASAFAGETESSADDAAASATASAASATASAASATAAANSAKTVFMVALGDETTVLTTGAAKVTFRMPFAMTLTAVRASLTTASTSGIPTFDINEGGVSILSTKLTIDANEKTSKTAATAAVISDTALADDAEMTVDIDVAGTGAAGAKIYLIGDPV